MGGQYNSAESPLAGRSRHAWGDQCSSAVDTCIPVRNYSQPSEGAGIISFQIWLPGDNHSQCRQDAMLTKNLCFHDLHGFHLWEARKHYNAKRWCFSCCWRIYLLYHLLNINTEISTTWLGALACKVILISPFHTHLSYLQLQSCNMGMLGEISNLALQAGQLGWPKQKVLPCKEDFNWSVITDHGTSLS